MAGGASIPWLLLEFARIDVPRAIALATAIAQASYAFAPALFGVIREWASDTDAATSTDLPVFFVIAATIQLTAALI